MAPRATIEGAPVTVAAVATVSIEAEPATGPTILIDRTHDPNRVAPGAVAAVDAIVQRALDRAGYATVSLGDQRREAELIVTPTVTSLTVSPEGARTTIECRITLRVSPWSHAEQVERWEAQSSASAMGEARATTSSARAQVELGMRDCLEGAVKAAAAREVIPFLRRVTRESKNFSGVTSHADL